VPKVCGQVAGVLLGGGFETGNLKRRGVEEREGGKTGIMPKQRYETLFISFEVSPELMQNFSN
jgi:hypothetical protein